MLRITKETEGTSAVTLRLEGQIMSAWVQVLEREVMKLLQSKQQVVLDFTEVKSVDLEGADMLRRIVNEDVEMINCPALIKGFLMNGQEK